MPSTVFLLSFLLCLGVAKADNHFYPPNAAAERIARGFLIFFQLNIEHRDMTQLSQKISNSFIFHACKLGYNKQKVLDHLKNLPKGSKVSLNLKSAQFIDGYDVQFTALVSGIGRSPFLAQLVIHRKNGNYVLLNGKISSCSRRQFVPSDATRIVYGFLAKMRIAISGQDVQQIALFFSDGFMFKGCTRTVNKGEAVEMLSHVASSGTKFKIALLSVDFVSEESIKYVVKIYGFGPARTDEFTMEKKNRSYVLTSGRAVDCDMK